MEHACEMRDKFGEEGVAMTYLAARPSQKPLAERGALNVVPSLEKMLDLGQPPLHSGEMCLAEHVGSCRGKASWVCPGSIGSTACGSEWWMSMMVEGWLAVRWGR
jgi:hypothetical protein